MRIIYIGPIAQPGKPAIGGYEAANRKNIDALKNKMQLITMHQLFTVTLATFGAIKSLQNDGMPVRISSLQTL